VTANSVCISLFGDFELQVSAYVGAFIRLLYKNINIKAVLFKKGKAFHFTMG
jgi:hypothetical protein